MAVSRRALVAAGLAASAGAGVLLALRQRHNPAGADPAGLGDLPEIVLNDLAGTPRSLHEWRGRTLLINFWATWCAPCRREMPLLQALQDGRSPERLQVIGIAIDRQDPVERFITETGVSYPILIGQQDAMAAAELFGSAFGALPFSVLVTPAGAILALHTGELKLAELEAMIAVADQVAEGILPLAEGRALLAAGGPDPA
jgi:thiol-disulfide isomerase/thioredoxin